MLDCLTDQNRHLWGKPSLVQSDRVDQTVHVGAMEKWHHTNCCVLQVNSPRVSPSVAPKTRYKLISCDWVGTSGARFRSTSFSLTGQDYTFKPNPLSDLSGSRACLIVCWSMGIFAPTSLVPGDLSSDDAGCHGTLASRELLRLPGQITLGKQDMPWKGSTHPNALPLAAGACIHGTLEGSACTGKTESCRRFHKECSWCSNAQDDGEIWIHIPDGT